MSKILRRIKGKATDNQGLSRRAKVIVPRAKSVPNSKETFEQRITPISKINCYTVSAGEFLDQIADKWECFGSKHADVCVINAENEIKPSTEGYNWSECSDVDELPDKKTVVLTFDPHDEEGRCRSSSILIDPENIIPACPSDIIQNVF